ncbi:helix-turn-helix domain-containing protein [Specibacter sp. RAF43]|uniref:helix-turn-helix domain-containing protein n=1 Tax=Specibacter sp. RAF43 TaxID=3233057 RepID=UPI003F94AD7C
MGGDTGSNVRHPNARSTVHRREWLVDRIRSGRPGSHVAKELGVSRRCAYRWLRCDCSDGLRPSSPATALPHRVHPEEQRRHGPAVASLQTRRR